MLAHLYNTIYLLHQCSSAYLLQACYPDMNAMEIIYAASKDRLAVCVQCGNGSGGRRSTNRRTSSLPRVSTVFRPVLAYGCPSSRYISGSLHVGTEPGESSNERFEQRNASLHILGSPQQPPDHPIPSLNIASRLRRAYQRVPSKSKAMRAGCSGRVMFLYLSLLPVALLFRDAQRREGRLGVELKRLYTYCVCSTVLMLRLAGTALHPQAQDALAGQMCTQQSIDCKIVGLQ